MQGLGLHWQVQQHFPFGQQFPIDFAVFSSGANITLFTATSPGFKLSTILCSLADKGILIDGAACITLFCWLFETITPDKAKTQKKTANENMINAILIIVSLLGMVLFKDRPLSSGASEPGMDREVFRSCT